MRKDIYRLWYIPVFSLTTVFACFGIFYIAHKTGKRLWMKIFVYTFLSTMLSLYLLPDENSDNSVGIFGILLLLGTWLFIVIFMIVTAKEFLDYEPGLPYVSPKFQEEGQLVNTPPISQPVNEVEKMGMELIKNLQHWKKEIESVSLQEDISQLIEMSQIVMKRNDEEGRKFFNRYADQLNNMLGKYDEIENTRINSPEMLKMMKLIEESVEKIVEAFRNEINEMYKKDILHLDADTRAFMQDLRYKGLID